MRLLLLKLSATLALWLCGCSVSAIPVPSPQPVNPAKQSLDINCSCGCAKAGCVCSASAKPAVSVAAPSRPVVTMFTSFADRSCGPCNAAKDAYAANGATWPFELVVKTEPGWTSPTFRYVGSSGRTFTLEGFASEDWLLDYWRKHQ